MEPRLLSWPPRGLFQSGPISDRAVDKAGRREVPGSISIQACRPSRWQISVVFSETRVNAG